MRDSEDSPQRRSAVVARELPRLDINVAALSEVHFAEQGSLVEDGTVFSLLWSRKNKDERCLSGVSFMIKTSIARKLQNLPIGQSGHLMSLSSQSRTTSMPLSSVCTHQICRLKLEQRGLSTETCITSCSKLTQKTNSSSWETSTQEWDEALNCGKSPG